jgi:hypothetical protein
MAKPLFIRSGAGAHLKAAALHLWSSVRHLGAALRVVLGHTLAAVIAIVVVFEEWGWRPLAAVLGRLATFRPIAAIESWVRGLPPYGALAVFGLPSVLLVPLKLLALYLVAHGFKAIAIGLFISAKVIGTAVVARLFMLTKDALMQIAWFRSGHDRLMPLKDALVAWVHDSTVWKLGRIAKARVKHALRPTVVAIKLRLAAFRQRLFGR